MVDDVDDGGDEILNVLSSIRESFNVSCGVSALASMATPKEPTASRFVEAQTYGHPSRETCASNQS